MYRILKAPSGRWGEGYEVGDLVPFDWEAAKVALEKGEIEEVIEEVVEKKEEFVCDVCGKVCASKLGLISHSRKHGK